MSMDTKFGQKQFTASVWVFTDTKPFKVLLLHHKKLNVWMQPGGHIEWNENPIEGAIREVQEETGLDISHILLAKEPLDDVSFLIPTPDFVMEQKIPEYNGVPEHIHVDLEYIVQVPEQSLLTSDSEAHGIDWFLPEEMPTLPMLENTTIIVNRILVRMNKNG